DFNCVLGPDLDRVPSRLPIPSSAVSSLQHCISDLGLVEVWRHLHPASIQCLYYSSVHLYSRIDMILISKSLLFAVEQCNYLARVISDHSPLSLDILLSVPPQNAPRWRMNLLFLQKETFCQYIDNQSCFSLSPEILWKTLKAYIQGMITAYHSVDQKKTEGCLGGSRSKFTLWNQNIIKLNSLMSFVTFSWPNTSLTLSTQNSIKSIQFSKAKFFFQGEQVGKLLAWQLRREEVAHTISLIRHPQVGETSDPQLINDAFVHFYQSLYSSKAENSLNFIDTFFSGISLPVI
uniref:Endonuclease/exonuclease/phosphatase domain-containing protein n=1 Tax=Latimeria chalumnae TaxID=7897 RepID=H3AHJ3_LATCH